MLPHRAVQSALATMPRPAFRGGLCIAPRRPDSGGRLLGPHESGDLVWIDKHLDRSRLAWCAADELPVRQLSQHLMDGWRCGPEEALQIRLGRWPPEHHCVVVHECQVLALRLGESLGHRIRVLAEHPGDRCGASPTPLLHGLDGTHVSDSVSAPFCSHGAMDQPSSMSSTSAWPKPVVPFTPGRELS